MYNWGQASGTPGTRIAQGEDDRSSCKELEAGKGHGIRETSRTQAQHPRADVHDRGQKGSKEVQESGKTSHDVHHWRQARHMVKVDARNRGSKEAGTLRLVGGRQGQVHSRRQLTVGHVRPCRTGAQRLKFKVAALVLGKCMG